MESKTVKQQIIEMLARLPDDTDYRGAIEAIRVLQAIEIGIAQADRGEVTDHDEFMRELLGEDEEVSSGLDDAGQEESQVGEAVHRPA